MTEPWSIVTVTTAVVLVLLAGVLRVALHAISARTAAGMCTAACLLVAVWTFQLELWPWDVISAAMSLLVFFAWAGGPAPNHVPMTADTSDQES